MGKKQKAKNKKQPATRQVGGRMSASPRLEFPPSGPSGVSNMSMSLARDKEAPAIVREILQNSLDAAVHAERECARVEFSLEDVSVKDIPGIKEYREPLTALLLFVSIQIGLRHPKHLLAVFETAWMKKNYLFYLFLTTALV